MKISRRDAIIGLSSTLLLPAGCSTGRLESTTATTAAFAHGVASGDPEADSVVLWTRVSGQDGPVDVRWSVATDPDMRHVVASGRTSTSTRRDYTVKVIADGLHAGTEYFYAFECAGTWSPIGRSRTLPTGNLDELVIAVASCSNYPFGYFNAYDAIANDPAVDIVVHLGDYIYEYGEDGYGGAVGKRLGRIHEPRHETVFLDDYRKRYAQYKADPGSRALHAAHPLIHTWDDHESANNPWSGGAENHQPDEGDWLERRRASLQAYYEWMPAREPTPAQPRVHRWQHYKFGNLASIITLETRHTGRSQEIVLDDYKARLTDAQSARRFYDEVVGAKDRKMLSENMENFLRIELDESVKAERRWRIIANQILLARIVMPNFDDSEFQSLTRGQYEKNGPLLDRLTRYGKVDMPFNMDAWDGYPDAREQFYAVAAGAGARDLLVITGDTHVFWQNRLANAAGDPMGVELGTSAITSPRGFYELGEAASTRLSELVSARNESVVWNDGRYRGYVRLSLTQHHARADYVAISTVESRNYLIQNLRSTVIVRDGDTLVYT